MNSYGYTQIVDKPTFVSAGCLLDQVYVNQFLSNKVQSEVNSVYYSDHDSVQTTIAITEPTNDNTKPTSKQSCFLRHTHIYLCNQNCEKGETLSSKEYK